MTKYVDVSQTGYGYGVSVFSASGTGKNIKIKSHIRKQYKTQKAAIHAAARLRKIHGGVRTGYGTSQYRAKRKPKFNSFNIYEGINLGFGGR